MFAAGLGIIATLAVYRGAARPSARREAVAA
jgi:hypothetical protein